MPKENIICDSCGSSFILDYEEDETSYSPSHCPFCGDMFSEESELDFNDPDDDLLEMDDLEDLDDYNKLN
jgi:hypothetical protein